MEPWIQYTIHPSLHGTSLIFEDANCHPVSDDMSRDYESQRIDQNLTDDLRFLVRLAIKEDIARTGDLTTLALVPAGTKGAASIIARPAGVAADSTSSRS